VVISAATQRLVQGLFVCQALGVQTLKDVPQPVAVYRVLGESEAHGRLDAAGPTGLTPLGREQEVGLLSGEAGIGKSRLVQVVKEPVASEPHLRWECRCSPYHQNSAFYPVIDISRLTGGLNGVSVGIPRGSGKAEDDAGVVTQISLDYALQVEPPPVRPAQGPGGLLLF
jgi:hypothetical protein